MKAFRDWDLACKINAAILLFLLVAGGLIGGVLYWKTRQILSEEVDTSARAAVRLAAERINRDFPVVEAAAQELALSIELLRPDEAQQKAMIRATLERLRKSVPRSAASASPMSRTAPTPNRAIICSTRM